MDLMGGSPAVDRCRRNLPSACPEAGIFRTYGESVGVCSERQAHQLLHRQRQDAEHQVAPKNRSSVPDF